MTKDELIALADRLDKATSGASFREVCVSAQMATKAMREVAAAISAQARASEAEPLAWESTTTAYIKFVTDSRYRKFSPAVQKWYRPICQKCATQGDAGSRGET